MKNLTCATVSLSALALLAACATPQERCINSVTRDMKTVAALIAQTEGNLQRGFALERETVYRTEFEDCTARPTPTDPTPTPRMCPVQVPLTTTRPVAIDLTAENAKLTSLQQKYAQQQAVAQDAIAQCRALHPE